MQVFPVGVTHGSQIEPGGDDQPAADNQHQAQQQAGIHEIEKASLPRSAAEITLCDSFYPGPMHQQMISAENPDEDP